MDIFILVTASIAGITSTGTLLLIFRYRRQYPINATKVLTCNTYLAIIFCSLILLYMYAYNLYGILHDDISLDNWWCYASSYLLFVDTFSLYYSCLLKACFRLFRIVFDKYKQLQTIRFTLQLIIFQWIMAFLIMIFPLYFHYFKYTPQLYQCLLPFTDLKAILITTSIMYYFPIDIVIVIYCYIMYYIKFKTNVVAQRNRHRDLTVLRRIIISVGILVILSFPTSILWMYYIATGYLHPLIYHIQWLIYAISLLILAFVITFLNPELQPLLSLMFRQNRRIQPVIIIPPHE